MCLRLAAGGGMCPPETAVEPCKCQNFVYGDNGNEKGILKLDCAALHLGDEKIGRILGAVVSSTGATSLMRVLDLSINNLTYIPHQISHFTELNKLFLNSNVIQSIKKGSLNFTRTLDLLDMECNSISYIEPGAFKGKSKQ